MNRQILRAVMWLFVSAALASCAVYGSRFVPIQGKAGEAIVYVYRDNGLIGHGLDLRIAVNRQPLSQLSVGTYHATHLPPGRYDFTAEAVRRGHVVLSGIENHGIRGNILLTLDVEQGAVYYLRLQEGLGSLLLDPVPVDQAIPELKGLRPAGEAG